jgi:hypothetical protein
MAATGAPRRLPLAPSLVVLLALLAFTTMHALAGLDLATSRHVVPLAGTQHEANATSAAAHAVGGAVHHAPPPAPPGAPRGHDHGPEVLAGCLIALTGLGLWILGRRGGGIRLRPRTAAAASSRPASRTPSGTPRGYAQLSLQVLRI